MYPYNINLRARKNVQAQLNKPKPPMNTMPEETNPTPFPKPGETNPPENNNNCNNNADNNMGIRPVKPQPCPCDRPSASKPAVNRYIIEMLKSALADEAADADYYNRLAELIECPEDRTLVHKIHHDETKHYNILSNIFYELTGTKPGDVEFEVKDLNPNLTDNFAASILSELEGVAFYRKLLFSFLNIELRDWFTEIITDEQSHAQIMNYLYSKYMCC